MMIIAMIFLTNIKKIDFRPPLLPEMYWGFDSLAFDGSIILRSETSIYHYSGDGRLLRTIGRPGDGPGTFLSPSSTLWDGLRYFVNDGRRMSIEIFDKHGNFLARRYYNFRNISFVNGKYFFLDYLPFMKEDVTIPALKLVEFDKNLNAVTKERFQLLDPIVFNYTSNFKLCFFTDMNDGLYILQQIRPVIYVYGKDFKLKRTIEAKLGSYVRPKPTKEVLYGVKAFEHYNTISMIHNMFRVNDYLCICFYGPTPGKRALGEWPKNKPCFMQLVDRNGLAVAPVVALQGPCLGVFKNKILFCDRWSGDPSFHWADVSDFLPGGVEGPHGKP